MSPAASPSAPPPGFLPGGLYRGVLDEEDGGEDDDERGDRDLHGILHAAASRSLLTPLSESRFKRVRISGLSWTMYLKTSMMIAPSMMASGTWVTAKIAANAENAPKNPVVPGGKASASWTEVTT